MYLNGPHLTTRETTAQLMLCRSTRLQFDAFMLNTTNVIVER